MKREDRNAILSVIMITTIFLTIMWIRSPRATQPTVSCERLIFEDGFESSTLKWATWTYNEHGVPEMVSWIQRSNDTAFHGDYSLAMTTGSAVNQIVVFERSVCLGPDVTVSMRGVMRVVDANGWGYTWWTELWDDDYVYIARLNYDFQTHRWTIHTEALGWIVVKGLPPLQVALLNRTAGGGAIWNQFDLRYNYQVKQWTHIEINGYVGVIPDVVNQFTRHHSVSWGTVCWGNSLVTKNQPSTIYFDDLQLIQHVEDG